MKTKLSAIIAMFIFLTTFSYSQSSSQKNALTASPNYYEKWTGTASTPSRSASDALVYIDYALENDFVADALLAQGYNLTFASGWADFNTKLLSGNYGLAVAFSQDFYEVPSPAAVQTYLNGGGRMILCDWTLDITLASLFEASYTNHYNQSQVFFSGSTYGNGISNPMTLQNPGWGIFSMGMAPKGGGQVLASFANGEAAAIKGNGGKTIILGYLSDTPPSDTRQQLFESALDVVNGKEIPVSDCAIYLGLILMVAFVAVRLHRAS